MKYPSWFESELHEAKEKLPNAPRRPSSAALKKTPLTKGFYSQDGRLHLTKQYGRRVIQELFPNWPKELHAVFAEDGLFSGFEHEAGFWSKARLKLAGKSTANAAKAPIQLLPEYSHSFMFPSRATRVLVSPDPAYRKLHETEFKPLDLLAENEGSRNELRGKLGYFTTVEVPVLSNDNKPKFRMLLIESIQHRHPFFGLPAKRKRELDRWYDSVLVNLEEQAAKTGISAIGILHPSDSHLRDVPASQLKQFYEDFPKRRGYALSTAKIGFLSKPYFAEQIPGMFDELGPSLTKESPTQTLSVWAKMLSKPS